MGHPAEYWLRQAEEARAIGAHMKDADFRDTLLRIAERYEALAKRAAAIQQSAGGVHGPQSLQYEFQSISRFDAGRLDPGPERGHVSETA